MEKEKQFVSYEEAVIDLDLILCNNIIKYHDLSDYRFRLEDYITDDIIQEVNEDDSYQTDEERERAIRDKAYERSYDFEISQYFLTNADSSDVEHLVKTYGLIFAYCEDLDNWVLLVDHYGTKWCDVEVEVK